MRKLLSVVDWDAKLNELTLEEMWSEIKDSIFLELSESVFLLLPTMMRKHLVEENLYG